MSNAATLHEPVLVDQVLAFARQAPPRVVVDGTVGMGGHAEALLCAFPGIQRYVGFDRDPEALTLARQRLAPFGDRIHLAHGRFEDMEGVLDELDGEAAGLILLDLGVSTFQLTEPGRGFSFRHDGPLDMRMNPQQGHPAWAWLADQSVGSIQNVLSRYGEVRGARRLARAIHKGRDQCLRTSDLVAIIEASLPQRILRQAKYNPTNQIFQALRIVVNDELGTIERGLPAAFEALAPDGLLVVISFHSLEDRLVKEFFKDRAGHCTCPSGLPVCGCGAKKELEILTRRVVRPDEAECLRNPASRSARLRAARKVAP